MSMDEQIQERLATMGAKNLTLQDEAKQLRQHIRKLEAQRTSPGASALSGMQGELDRMAAVHDESLGCLDVLQKRYDQLHEDWEAERAETARLQAEVDELQRPAPVAEEPPPEWHRELWVEIYKHAYVVPVESPATDADAALAKARARFDPNLIDTTPDPDEG